jgi:hypothetical protein
MDIKNHDYAAQSHKRERALSYWQNNVIQNHLPPIDLKKKLEMQELKKHATSSMGRRDDKHQYLLGSSSRNSVDKKRTLIVSKKSIRTEGGLTDT